MCCKANHHVQKKKKILQATAELVCKTYSGTKKFSNINVTVFSFIKTKIFGYVCVNLPDFSVRFCMFFVSKEAHLKMIKQSVSPSPFEDNFLIILL